MKIRLTCLPEEMPRALETIRAAFTVDEDSREHTSRGGSRRAEVFLDVRMRAVEITPAIAAHVLHHFGAPGGYEPGSFIHDLIMLVARADPENRALLALAHPAYVLAVSLAQASPGGVPHLQAITAADTAATP